jgi:type II secretory pathway component PulJ
MYQYLPAMLLNEFQKQQRTIAAQTTHIAELERERQTLKAAVAEIVELKRQTAHLARLLGEQRAGTVTAGLELK